MSIADADEAESTRPSLDPTGCLHVTAIVLAMWQLYL